MKNYNINIKYMNITLDLSKGQLSKLRNGHGIRITPTMLGSGVDLIIDPMTYHNMAKKMDKGKGVVIKRPNKNPAKDFCSGDLNVRPSV